MDLPVLYDWLTPEEKGLARDKYFILQKGLCLYCKSSLKSKPPEDITEKYIDWSLFPRGFLRNPLHLHHNHKTGMTEGVVHAYCNGVLWFYHGK